MSDTPFIDFFSEGGRLIIREALWQCATIELRRGRRVSDTVFSCDPNVTVVDNRHVVFPRDQAFQEYWRKNNKVFRELGVDRDIAWLIWSSAWDMAVEQ